MCNNYKLCDVEDNLRDISIPFCHVHDCAKIFCVHFSSDNIHLESFDYEYKSGIIISNDVSMTHSSFSKSQIPWSSLDTRNACESLVACGHKLYNVECREY